MNHQRHHTFPDLARCVGFAGRTTRLGSRQDASGGGYRELWSARRLVDAARLALASARWEASDDECVPVALRDFVLLEAALNAATGVRADTHDGFPHLGAAVTADGRCDVGPCPCLDALRVPQPRLLGRVA